jgi:hypothetical protein
MKMVCHEHPSKDTPAASDRHPIEQLAPVLAIGIVAHHHTPLPDAACHVIKPVLDVNSQSPIHDPIASRLKF